MENLDNLYNQIYSNMQLKTTEELKLILEQDDHEEWSDTAFEIVKQILVQRTGTLPDLPNSSDDSKTLPTGWDNINWLAVSNKFKEKYEKTGGLTFVLALFAFLPILLGTIIFFSSPNKNHDIDSIGILFLIGAFLFGLFLWSYIRFQRADRIVAKARVLVKSPISRNKGSIYDVMFAIKPAYILSDGELIANEKWMGHQTLFMVSQLYDRINEQDVLNLVFLSTKQVLGFVEDFVGEEEQPNIGST